MSYNIQDTEGTGPSYADKLAIAKIKTTNDLLRFCADKKGRFSVSEMTGLGESQLLKWARVTRYPRSPRRSTATR